jgi:uncharacterized protein with PQ loop repeat
MTDAAAAIAAASAAAVAASSDAAVVAPLVQSAVSAASASTSLRVQVSQALGLLVSGGSALVKLPQLVSLLRSRSTRGVSLEMYVLELLAQSVAVLYHRLHGFPVATYGENLTLGAGNVAILLAFVALGDEAKSSRNDDGGSNSDGDRRSASSSSFISSFSRSTRLRALAALALPVALLPLLRFPALLSLLQSLSIPMNIAAKLPQIRINQRLIDQLTVQRDRLLRARWAAKLSANASGSSSSNTATSGAASSASRTASSSPASAAAPASSLSSVPFVLNLLGSVSRLYTTMAQLAGDRVLLLSFGVSIALNAAIIVQCRRMEFLQRQCETAALELERQLQPQQQQQPQLPPPAAAGSENGSNADTAVSH